MKSDIGEVYDDLSILLNDICNFLNNEATQLSPKAAAKASELIKRSRTKLVEISKIIPDNDSSRYVDMTAAVIENGKKEETTPEYFDPDAKPKIEEESPEIYSDIDAEQEKHSQNQTKCPYEAFPAKSLPKEKIDFIERKTKFLFIDHYKKLYAGIIDDWMLLYYSDKDNKPFEMLHLKQYETKLVEKKEVAFELIPKDGNGRNHFFAASTKKDMVQWVSVINRKISENNFSISKPLPKTPIEVSNKIPIEEPQIYEELSNESDNKPPLTPNRKRSAEENYDFLDRPDDFYDHIGGSKNIGSDHDSEEIYDTITPLSRYEVEETYDTIGRAVQ